MEGEGRRIGGRDGVGEEGGEDGACLRKGICEGGAAKAHHDVRERVEDHGRDPGVGGEVEDVSDVGKITVIGKAVGRSEIGDGRRGIEIAEMSDSVKDGWGGSQREDATVRRGSGTVGCAQLSANRVGRELALLEVVSE